MIDLLQTLGDFDGENARLKEIRLGAKPVTVMFFSSTGEAVQLHFEQDPTVNAYVICPGTGCPSCFLAERPTTFSLVPAYDMGLGNVGVLRVSNARGSTTLGTQVFQFLQRTDLTDVAARISRDGRDYSVVACPLTEHADRGQAAIQRYLDEKPSLLSAFASLTVEEMAEVPRIRKLLNAFIRPSSVEPVPTPKSAKPPQAGT